MDAKDIARFMAKVDRSGGPDACHPWIGLRNGDGYGRFKWNGKKHTAPRLAFLLEYGHWPEPCCLHRCDVRACCNARHLFEGTQVDNIADMNAKGRGAAPNGQRHGCAKLTDQQVLDIRAAYSAGGVTQRELGARYGVNRSYVGSIINGRKRSYQ